MTAWLDTYTPETVASADDPVMAFAEYAQQTIGVPWPTVQDRKILRKKINEFFEHYPQADFYTLCRIVGYCKQRRKRFGRVWAVVEQFRDAYEDGFLPELDPSSDDPDLELKIEQVLEAETDPDWRRRLLGATGQAARREAYNEWLVANAGRQYGVR